MPLTLYYRNEDGMEMPEPLAAWESPAHVSFPSVHALQAAADAQGLKDLFYSGPEALFPDCATGTARFGADAEELVWELAGEHTEDPEDATTWPAGFGLLQFLVFWRLPLNEMGAHLELINH
jgi:hypothetical protein